jgi:hypothetical protein
MPSLEGVCGPFSMSPPICPRRGRRTALQSHFGHRFGAANVSDRPARWAAHRRRTTIPVAKGRPDRCHRGRRRMLEWMRVWATERAQLARLPAEEPDMTIEQFEANENSREIPRRAPGRRRCRQGFPPRLPGASSRSCEALQKDSRALLRARSESIVPSHRRRTFDHGR